MRELTTYTLPDGRLVPVDETAAKGATFIDFTLEDGTIVIASRTCRQEAIERYQASNRVAQAADDALSTLLRAKYGKRAGDMRYRPAETVEIGGAMQAYLKASEAKQMAWLAYQRVKP